MPITSKTPKEWIDGFLFVGNHLALDFLNTRPVLAEGPQELLPDVDALARWLVASGVLTRQKGKALARKWRDLPQAAGFLRELLKFRERLRATVVRQEAGFSVSGAFIAELNSLLKQHPGVIASQRKGETLGLETDFELEEPSDVRAPIAIAVAELLSDVSPVRLRKCEARVVHFLDTSKKGASLVQHEHRASMPAGYAQARKIVFAKMASAIRKCAHEKFV